MLERIKHMLIKEFIQLSRDTKMRAMLLIFPIVQTVIFGYAVTTDVKHISTAIYDEDKSVVSRNFINAFVESGYFNVVYSIDNQNQMDDLMDHGKVMAILHIGKDFEQNLLTGQTAYVQAIIDGTDSNTAVIVQNYMSRITQQQSQKQLAARTALVNPSAKNSIRVQVDSRAWFNANLESRNFYVPGVVATLITLFTLTLTSMAIVREKEIGTMEQIMVTPINPLEFILGKTIPFILIGFFNIALILLVAIYWFEVPLAGHLWILMLGVCLYLLTTLGVGLIISAVSQTQQQSMMSAFAYYFPSVLLSGFIFPISNMPTLIQWATYLNPLRYFLVVVRGVFLKGIGMEILWPQMIILGIMGLCTLTAASRFFKKTMS